MVKLFVKSVIKFTKYYGLSVISVTVTKEGHPRHSKLYKTSGTMGRGVTKSRKKFSTWKYGNVGTRYTDILTYRRTQPLLWGGVIYLSI